MSVIKGHTQKCCAYDRYPKTLIINTFFTLKLGRSSATAAALHSDDRSNRHNGAFYKSGKHSFSDYRKALWRKHFASTKRAAVGSNAVDSTSTTIMIDLKALNNGTPVGRVYQWGRGVKCEKAWCEEHLWHIIEFTSTATVPFSLVYQTPVLIKVFLPQAHRVCVFLIKLKIWWFCSFLFHNVQYIYTF